LFPEWANFEKQMILGLIIDIRLQGTLPTFISEIKRLRFHSLDTLSFIRLKGLALFF
jgi:hypothetical protein